jgi:putative lipoic acid-binding regulatory protein
MNSEELEFKEKLEEAHNFPGSYSFKFIVKKEHQNIVEKLVIGAEIRVKPSSGNKYVSITIHAQMNSSEEVINVYKAAKRIDGIIAL